jgi:hypothetical protein
MIKYRREFAVLLESYTPILETGEWVSDLETTFARFLEVNGNKTLSNCLKLKLFSKMFSVLVKSICSLAELMNNKLLMEKQNAQLPCDH